MKIINIGILAHVDAGKTTLTESLLYASGAISEPGSVEKGTTRTDTMFLERQRGITIQAAVTSFQWHRCKVNIVDTPGHMDFLAEVYRSLAVLDGAILVISAKDGVQAQTRILFHALRKMNIPTVIFINKIDQAGVDLQSVVQSVRDKLSADIIIKQTVSLSPEIVLEENTDIEAWDAVIENNDELLEKYIAGEPISREKLAREEQQRVQDASLFPVYHGSAKNGLGIQPLMDAVTGLFQPIGEQGGAALCGSVFKVEYTDCGQRRVYLRLYSGTLRLRDTVALAGREKLKITEMRIPSKGEIVRTDTAYQGEIVILPSDSVRLNDVLGDQTRLPRKRWREDPLPMLRTTIAPKTAAQRERLLDALTQLADTDPLLRCEVDSITHEIILSFLGRVQLEVVSALLSEKYKLETVVKEPSVIYMERPQEDILRISALDFANKLLFQTELPLTADDDAMSLSNYIQQVYEDLAHSQGFSGIEFVGVGLSVSGGQGHKNRQLTNGLHSNFDNTSLEELIRQRTGLPCYTESQANLCVVSVSQAGHDSENILYLHSSTILSVGVICEGNLLRGRNGNAADIAHIPIGAPDNVCPRCGAHGCIENDLAQRGMDIFWTPQLSEDERTRLLEDRGKKLGELLSILINLFDPQTVYIGGRGFEIYELLEPYALSVLKVRSPSAFDNGLHIEHDRNSADTVQRGINQLVYKNWNPM